MISFLHLTPEGSVRTPLQHPKLRRTPHPASTLDTVRRLVERTTLSYRAIAARTGVSLATISRHARAGGWLRPDAGYGEEHYTPEGRRRLRRLALAESILKRAERLVFRTEMDPAATPSRLRHAMQLVRISKRLDEMDRPKPRRRRRKRPFSRVGEGQG